MKITIANLKHSPSLSEETHAFTATILIDGVRAFEASNHGTGGPDAYHTVKGYTGPSPIEVDTWLKTNTPQIEAYGMKLDNSMEIVVGDLINAELVRKDFMRKVKAKILVLDSTGEKPVIYAYKAKPTPEAIAQYRAAIAAGKIKGELVNDGDEALYARAIAAMTDQ